MPNTQHINIYRCKYKSVCFCIDRIDIDLRIIGENGRVGVTTAIGLDRDVTVVILISTHITTICFCCWMNFVCFLL
jgi:hypothetical protein